MSTDGSLQPRVFPKLREGGNGQLRGWGLALTLAMVAVASLTAPALANEIAELNVPLGEIQYAVDGPPRADAPAGPLLTATVTSTWTSPEGGSPVSRTFEGHVYIGEAGNPNFFPLAGVRVNLHGSYTDRDVGVLLDFDMTGRDGVFSLSYQGAEAYAYLNVVETDPGPYESTGAVAGPGGVTRGDNWVQYEDAGPGTYGGIAFYDVLIVSGPPTETPTSTPTITPAPWTFEGYVYVGEASETDVPLAGVLVELYGSDDADETGALLDSDVTDVDGVFSLSYRGAEAHEYLNVVETDPDSYVSRGAACGAEGAVRGDNWVQYEGISPGVYEGIAFYDVVQPVAEPFVVHLPLLYLRR